MAGRDDMSMKAIATILLGAALSGSQETKVPDAVKKAQAKLAENGDDPEANLTVGKHLMEKGDFEKGLPLLVKGSDKALKELAEKDLAGGKTSEEEMAIGDAWAKRSKERATFWYQKAWGGLRGDPREKVRHKLRAMVFKQGRQVSMPPGGWTYTEKVGKAAVLDESCAVSGRFSLKAAAIPGPVNDFILSKKYSATPGRSYVVSVRLLTESTPVLNDRLYISFLGTDGKSVGLKHLPIPEDQPWWSKSELTAQAPANAVSFEIGFNLNFDSGTVWLDDVSVKEEGSKTELLQNGGFDGR